MASSKEGQKALAQNVLSTIRGMFHKHQKTVDRMNSDQKQLASSVFDSKEPQFLKSLSQLKGPLSTLIKNVNSNSKTRKQKKNSYIEKLTDLSKWVQTIQKKKSLPIKINDFILDLVKEMTILTNKVIGVQQNYLSQGGFSCGGGDYKGMFEVLMNDLTENAYLLRSFTKLQSKTLEGPVQLYVPVEYQQSAFSTIYQQIERVWPTTVVIKQKQKSVQKEKEKEITYVQIREDDKLREAHEKLFGLGRPQDVETAIKIYQEEVVKENIPATNCLASIYQEGKFKQRNLKKAFNLYKRSAESNDAEGLYKIGQFLEKGIIKSQQAFPGIFSNRQAQIKGAMDYLQRAAKMGHLDAITDLGFIYQVGIKSSEGYYVQPNTEYAQKYYQKAKKQNFPRALNNLAVFYLNHPDFPQQVQGQNEQKAFKYLQRAVQAGYPKAYGNLGKLYENGQVVAQNKSYALKLYTEGSTRGDLDSKLGLALSLMRDNISENKKMVEAAELFREIITEDKNNAEAKYYLALMHEKGIGANKDPDAAYHLVENAALKLGHPQALNKLGDYHFSGFGCSKDEQLAITLYKKAAILGDTQALVNLGLLYEQGIIQAPAGFDKAEQLYQQAASSGNHNGVLHLGLLNWHNHPHQNSAAIFKKASEMGNPYANMVLQKTQKAPSVLSSNLKNEKSKLYRTSSSKITHQKRNQSLIIS